MLILRYHGMWLYGCNFILKISLYFSGAVTKDVFVNDGKWKELCVLCTQCCWVCLITAFSVAMMWALWRNTAPRVTALNTCKICYLCHIAINYTWWNMPMQWSTVIWATNHFGHNARCTTREATVKNQIKLATVNFQRNEWSIENERYWHDTDSTDDLKWCSRPVIWYSELGT